MSYFTRYMAGEHEGVWAELTALGEEVRSENILEDAQAVAKETMRRVVYNLQILSERLPACGYRFNAPKLNPPEQVFRPANDDDIQMLRRLESEDGPLPLSLDAFYSVVGAVDYAQDYDQLIQWPEREDKVPFTELEMLGEYNPLSISSLSFLLEHRHPSSQGVEVPLVPDEAGNAFYSGDYYYTPLPALCADASMGTYDGSLEYFVGYLRQAFQHSGFHGMPNTDENKETIRWHFPTLPCIVEITRELLPI